MNASVQFCSKESLSETQPDEKLWKKNFYPVEDTILSCKACCALALASAVNNNVSLIP